MVQRNVIVRKLDSLEALGAVTDICSDKTGTLTQGKMVCKFVCFPARCKFIIVESKETFNPTAAAMSFTTQSPFETKVSDEKKARREDSGAPAPTAQTATADEMIKSQGQPLESLLNIASMCNVAKVYEGDEGWTARGDPTECAIQVLAHRFQWGRESLTEGDSKQWCKLCMAKHKMP